MTWYFNSILVAVAVYGIAIVLAVRAAAGARTPQGAVGWVVFLLAAPWFGIVGYLFFGAYKYRGYVSMRRDSKVVARQLKAFGDTYAPDAPTAIDPAPFAAIADMPAVCGNGMQLFPTGEALFDAMFDDIAAATSYVLVQFYELEDDALGNRLKDALKDAAGRGVAVRVMFDGVGSYNLPRRYVDDLRSAGVDVMDPVASNGPSHRFQINFRNHRKTVVIDGQAGYIGGNNARDAYLGRDPRYGPWRDTHVRITGPMVTQLQLVFAEDWHWGCGRTLNEALDWDPVRDPENRCGLIVPTGPGDDIDSGALLFVSAIAAAQRRVWIATPYFVPDVQVIAALIHARLRGVEVRVLTPDNPDRYLPWLAAFSFFDEVRAAGVEIWRYEKGFMHQKVVLVDDDLALVGSHNLDNRSFRLNFEASAVFFDPDAAAQVARMLEEDFATSHRLDTPIEEQAILIRMGAPVARLFSPLM